MSETSTTSSIKQIPHRFWPILSTLAAVSGAMHRRQIIDIVADRLGLDGAARDQRIPSGKVTTHAHRTGWALQHLKHAGLVRADLPGTWGLTPEGRAYIAARPDGLTAEDTATLMRATGQSRVASDGVLAPGLSELPPSPSEAAENASAGSSSGDQTTPEEQIDHALGVLKQSVVEQLLDRLQAGTPRFFEFVVSDLLQKMGYGTARDDLRRVVGSGDAGIDGIISLDRLGLEKVYIQAKRWQNNVGRPEIQGFFGALHGRHANKGVFITTSRFTREAHDFATSVSDTIVLVDGQTLAELMIEYGVGVTRRPVYLPDVDSDYFDDE